MDTSIAATSRDGAAQTRRKYLVIVRAGDKSLHPAWLAGEGDRTWDLVVNYFGADPEIYREPGVIRIDSKGPKWPALFELIRDNPSFLENYRHVWLPDDDLAATKSDINRLFSICEQYGLEVAQPALTWNSYFGHLTTLYNGNFRLRYTNYVEVMAPCFSAAMLRRVFTLFNYNLSGWGLDFVWAKLAPHPESEIAIIDEVTVRHTRPVGGPNYKALKEKGVSPWDELRDFCKQHGIDQEPVMATHKAIRQDGGMLDARARPRRFALRLITGYLPALRDTPLRRQMLRRMAGMLVKGMFNIPDRVAEAPMLGSRPGRT